MDLNDEILDFEGQSLVLFMGVLFLVFFVCDFMGNFRRNWTSKTWNTSGSHELESLVWLLN